MFYCENCKKLCLESVCGSCGKKELRYPKQEDFCFLTELNTFSGKMLKEIFDAENIPCALIPSGTGLRTVLALNLENYKMFVPYASYDEAFRIFKEVFGGFNSPYKKELEENLEKLNISKKTEKKCRKKLRLSADANILEFLKKKVLCAERVTDEGQSWDVSSGRYLNVYCGDLIIYIVTKKWEIFSVSFQK